MEIRFGLVSMIGEGGSFGPSSFSVSERRSMLTAKAKIAKDLAFLAIKLAKPWKRRKRPRTLQEKFAYRARLMKSYKISEIIFYSEMKAGHLGIIRYPNVGVDLQRGKGNAKLCGKRVRKES